jgi:hypothetical protein
MNTFSVEISWNHKGSRYEKKSFERGTASRVSGAVEAAMKEAKKKHPGSLRVVLGERIQLAVTMIGKAELA